MSILPYLINALTDDYDHRHWGNDHQLYLTPADILQISHRPTSVPSRTGQCLRRPWKNLAAGDSNVTTFSNNKNEFKVNLDVQQFKPDELKLKVVDGFLVVDGKHEERSDEHGFISRQFTRRYKIPEDVDQEKLSSHLSSDGVLSISAPKIVKDEPSGREIPIVQTNQPAVKQSSQAQQDRREEEKKDDSQMES
ncbi:alpha-crystallin A chain [Halyomorpha halys]|uniref:alpha-crystallin A chain n=1 Tax=Halyomorpha halys TaxID=286706 RepID=UPI0006D51784|nr:alpha-crystallin A chain-like [Halyomorpha halys]